MMTSFQRIQVILENGIRVDQTICGMVSASAWKAAPADCSACSVAKGKTSGAEEDSRLPSWKFVMTFAFMASL